MKKILYTTTAFVLCGIAQSQAACIPTPSCTSLGYTSTTSCTDGLKCPFGNYWNCTHINKITELTNKITEQTNKITELEKTIETVKQESASSACQIGAIFYSDKTCSTGRILSKTPIGVVVYNDGNGHGQVLALNSIGQYYWNKYGSFKEIPGLPSYDTEEAVLKDYNSCANTEKIIAAGNETDFPAAWAAHEYKTEGTSAGDWCLPAIGILSSTNKNVEIVNNGIAAADGSILNTSLLTMWSSDIKKSSSSKAKWYFNFDYRRSMPQATHDETPNNVRPVLEF